MRNAYDKGKWHSDGQFPSDLDSEAGATHIGLFFAWAVLRGLASEDWRRTEADVEGLLRRREIAPGEAVKRQDGVLLDEDLSPQGNAFAADYYGLQSSGRYMDDYEAALARREPTVYHVADTWVSFDQLAPILDARLAQWLKWRELRWWQRLRRFGRRWPKLPLPPGFARG